MAKPIQYQLPLVKYEFQKEVIHQRIKDGYVNATAMCSAAGKSFGNYQERKTTQAFLSALSADIGVQISDLVEVNKGNMPGVKGTWVHPQVAIDLAQWLSPEFAIQVNKWVYKWMQGSVSGSMPYHLRRYMTNMTNVPAGHFSILNEMMLGVIAPLEKIGYTLPESLLPDISQGKMFSSFLRKQGYHPEKMPNYQHYYEDGRVVPARAYPNDVLALFRQHLNEVWLQGRALEYFKARDPKALPYIEKLLALPNYSHQSNQISGN